MKKTTKLFTLILTVMLLLSFNGTASLAAGVSVAAPTKVSTSSKSDSVTIKWNKVSNATGYRVYQRIGGKWVKLKTQATLTYTVKSLTASTTYTFAIRSYRKYNNSTYWSAIKTVKVKTKAMPDITTSKGTATKNSVTVKWAKVAGATGYRVYQYQNKKWVKLKDTAALSYTLKNLKYGTKYYFRIKPYAKTPDGVVWGDTSKTVSIQTLDPTKTKITSAAAGETDVTLKWSKVSGATGYRVFVRENNAWKKVITTANTQYKVTKLSSNTAYTFCVRAYYKKGSKVTWYTKSDNITVTTKASQNDLKAYRIEKYKKILSSDELFVKITSNDENLGTEPIEFAVKGESLYMKATMEGLTARVVYNATSKKAYMIIDSIFSYAEIPQKELESMNVSEMVKGLRIENVGTIKVTQTKFDGKNAICESYVDTVTGETVKYYFISDVLVSSERITADSEKTVINFKEISTTVSSSLFDPPPKYYVDLSGALN